MREKPLVFGTPFIGEEEIREVSDTLRSGWLGTGPKTKHFEAEFSKYVHARHAVGLNSCTAAMHLALRVAGIGPGDEVITSTLTFPSTANVIIHCGATPVFADVYQATMNIDPEWIESVCTDRTRAIIPVHMAGRSCQMDEILDFSRSRDLLVIEDAAHAVEAWYKDRKIGNVGDMTAFSFYVTKNLTTGEGGMLTTNREDWEESIRIQSLHGISKDAWKRYASTEFQPYETLVPGYKYNMTDLQASLGLHQLARLERNLEIRDQYWKMYNEVFSGIEELIVPIDEPHGRHARHLYTILLRIDLLDIDRNQFISQLLERNIGTGVHFTALHLHQYFRETFGLKRGDFPIAEWISDRTVSLPLSARLKEEDVLDVIKAVCEVIQRNRRPLLTGTKVDR